MSGRAKTRQTSQQGSSDFELEFVSNDHGDDRKLTRAFLALRLHRAAQEVAAQAQHEGESGDGGHDGCA